MRAPPPLATTHTDASGGAFTPAAASTARAAFSRLHDFAKTKLKPASTGFRLVSAASRSSVYPTPMLLLAVTALEKIKAVPPMFWVKAFAVIAGFIVVYLLLQKLAHLNKLVIGVVFFVGLSILSIVWVYDRSEPAFMTWLIEPIADSGFLPTKGGTDLRTINEDGTKGPKKVSQPAPKKK